MMPHGPGKYDDACTAARETTGAEAVLLMVIGGNKGSGFSMQMHDREVLETLPTLLRRLADDIEQQNAEG